MLVLHFKLKLHNLHFVSLFSGVCGWLIMMGREW